MQGLLTSWFHGLMTPFMVTPRNNAPFYGSDAELERDPPLRIKPVSPQAHELTTSSGSWQNPRIRKDGVATRTTTVHLPLDLASKLDEVRIRTHRRLSDLLTEAAREWLARRR